MRILRKDGANILVVASPTENVRLGDYLMVADKDERSLILQIYDESYLDVSGIEEEVAREEVLFASTAGRDRGPCRRGDHLQGDSRHEAPPVQGQGEHRARPVQLAERLDPFEDRLEDHEAQP